MDPDAPAVDPLLARARVASSAKDAVVVLDPARRRLHVLTGAGADPAGGTSVVSRDLEDAPVAMLPMRLNADALTDLVILGAGHEEPTVLLSQATRTFVITTTGDEPDRTQLPSDGGLCDVDLAAAWRGVHLAGRARERRVTTRDAGSTRPRQNPSSRSEPAAAAPGRRHDRREAHGGDHAGDLGRERRRGGCGRPGSPRANSAVRNLRVTGFAGHGLLISGTPPPGGGATSWRCAFDGNGGHGVFIEEARRATP
jgi:hypothetical protein